MVDTELVSENMSLSLSDGDADLADHPPDLHPPDLNLLRSCLHLGL